MPGLVSDAAATVLQAAGMVSRLASASIEALRQSSSDETVEAEADRDGPEIAGIEEEEEEEENNLDGHSQTLPATARTPVGTAASSSSEEESDLSGSEAWEDAKEAEETGGSWKHRQWPREKG